MAALFLVHPRATSAATWYVDPIAAGTNAGTSWANAWTSFSSIKWTSISPGDALYISGGSTSQTYTTTLTVSKSGTSGNPITITLDAANSAHNGTVIFDDSAEGMASTRTAISLGSNTYVTISGNVGGANHFVIQNFQNSSNQNSGSGITASGVDTGLNVDHVTFTDVNDPITYSGSSVAGPIEIKNCYLHRIWGDHGISFPGSGPTSFDQILIHDNQFEVVGKLAGQLGADGIQTIGGTSIYNNTFLFTPSASAYSSGHPDMVQIQFDDVKIYNNDFRNIGDSDIDYDCYKHPTPHDIYIYNNVFHIVTVADPYPNPFRFYTSQNTITSITNFKIWNNVFADGVGNDAISFFNFLSNPTGSGNEIKNNIFVNWGTGTGDTEIRINNSTGFTASSFDINYNVYFNNRGTAYINYLGTSYTAASWVAAHESNGKIGLPAFANYLFNSATNDFHLTATDKVALDAGLSLASYFTTDKDGVTRPQGAAWDIGPYEFGVNRPAAPTNVRIIR